MRHTKRASADAAQWAQAFTDGFERISAHMLGGVRVRATAVLDHDHIAVVYDDWEGKVMGRVYFVEDLNDMDLHQKDPAITAAGLVMGELIEPSAGDAANTSELLRPLDERFPGLHWIGITPSWPDPPESVEP